MTELAQASLRWADVGRRRAASAALVVAGASGATVAGAMVAAAPRLCLGLLAAAAVAVAVWVRPVTAAVLVSALTPLVAGIDRGRLLPVLRPNEALVAFLAGVLILRAVVLAPTGTWPRLRPTRLEWAVVAMALTNSVVLLVVMLLRGQQISGDDLSYALVLWKYLALYALVRAAVRSDRDVGLCLGVALAAATVVGVIGMLQALDLAGVRGLLVDLYAPFGYTGALALPRGGSTLGLPAATADLLILNLAAATGLWWKDHRHGLVLLLASTVCIGGTLAAAEFSSAFGLALAVVCTAVVGRKPGSCGWRRSASQAPQWPCGRSFSTGSRDRVRLGSSRELDDPCGEPRELLPPPVFSGTHPFLGVRPAARVVAEHQGTGFVWIESGYVWLVWGGGLPLLLSFAAFVLVAVQTLVPRARALDSSTAVAALAAVVGVVVVAASWCSTPTSPTAGPPTGCSRCWPWPPRARPGWSVTDPADAHQAGLAPATRKRGWRDESAGGTRSRASARGAAPVATRASCSATSGSLPE